jgi:hypothetical protein
MQARQRRKNRSTSERLKVAEGAFGLDINGAKALKERLSRNGARQAPPVAEAPDVPADAPPVYHWTGKTPPETASAEVGEHEDEIAPRASLFSRLGLSFR